MLRYGLMSHKLQRKALTGKIRSPEEELEQPGPFLTSPPPQRAPQAVYRACPGGPGRMPGAGPGRG